MTTSQASYLLVVNTAMLGTLIVIAIRLSRGYNKLVKQGVNDTLAPRERKPEIIEVDMYRWEINALRERWLDAGYTVSHSRNAGGGVITLTMTKKASGNSIR